MIDLRAAIAAAARPRAALVFATLAAAVLCGSPAVEVVAEELKKGEPAMADLVTQIVNQQPAASGETKDLADGVKLGKFQLIPYGALWGDMIYATSRTATGPFTLWAFSEESQGEEGFHLDFRRTRLGFDVKGPDANLAGESQSSGRVEIDFFGEFVTENRASVLLRHAYWQLENDDYKLLAGQSWDVISPLLPGMLNYPVGWQGGNIGFRRAQLQLERRLHPTPDNVLSVQASINQDVVAEFLSEPGILRETAGWPVLEGRLAYAFGDPNARYGRPQIGVSGHVGETGFDFLVPGPPPLNLPPEDDARFLTWSMNLDARLPLTDLVGINMEFFHGQNLSAFLGGIGQGVCPCTRTAIRATGGWADMWFELTSRLHARCGFGIDDPLDEDIQTGRSENHFLFANTTYDVTPELLIGLEVSVWKTQYVETRAGQIAPELLGPTSPGEAVVIQWMVRYGF